MKSILTATAIAILLSVQVSHATETPAPTPVPTDSGSDNTGGIILGIAAITALILLSKQRQSDPCAGKITDQTYRAGKADMAPPTAC